jgi:mRNA-degrading endonuclease toxin of MazEF toxin-antitoxin module
MQITLRGDIFYAEMPEDGSAGSEQYGSRPVLVLSVGAINTRSVWSYLCLPSFIRAIGIIG